MNVFVVPSWYPSNSNPAFGIFIKEQIELLAAQRPTWKIGVSTWGQGEQKKLLYAKDHLFNVSKVWAHQSEETKQTQPLENLTEFYHPALSWTKKWRRGNLANILKASDSNFQRHARVNGQPDIIWVQAAYPGSLIGKYLSDRYKIPYIMHMRLGGFMFEKLLYDTGKMAADLLESINQAYRVTTTSEFQRQSLIRFIPVSEVVYNPVNTDHFQLASDPGKGILVISRLEDEKGIAMLIEAMNEVASARLKIAGVGSKHKKLREQIGALGLHERVTFLGALDRSEIRNEIQKCSFLVLPSRFETFGNVLLEAMACGKPVVATRCGGPEEIFTKETGYLCEPNSTDLADKINKMIRDRDTFDSKKIRDIIINKFSPQVWVEQVERIFKAVVSR